MAVVDAFLLHFTFIFTEFTNCTAHGVSGQSVWGIQQSYNCMRLWEWVFTRRVPDSGLSLTPFFYVGASDTIDSVASSWCSIWCGRRASHLVMEEKSGVGWNRCVCVWPIRTRN